jgi:hypothetical protein
MLILVVLITSIHIRVQVVIAYMAYWCGILFTWLSIVITSLITYLQTKAKFQTIDMLMSTTISNKVDKLSFAWVFMFHRVHSIIIVSFIAIVATHLQHTKQLFDKIFKIYKKFCCRRSRFKVLIDIRR